MLDYETVAYLSNGFATGSSNLQPYSTFSYSGSLVLLPAVDTWNDINTRPDLVIRDTSIFDAMLNLTDSMAESGIGTVWSEWEETGNVTTTVDRGTDRSVRQRAMQRQLEP